MKILAIDDIRRIAIDAAAEAGLTGVSDADVTTVMDSLDEPSYSIRLKYEGDHGSSSTIGKYAVLKQKIRDALLAQGDDHYPYVSYLRDDAWIRRSRA